MRPRVIAVVGAGISGLTITYELIQRAGRFPRGVEVLCLEAAERPGGNIRTERAEGFVCEWGPTGFLDSSPATLELARRLGLQDRLLAAGPAAEDRFVFRRGRLRQVPLTPLSFLRSRVLSPWGKLRLLAEPFARGPRGDGDESVFHFAARRIGREAASVLVDAMVSGVYAGNARRLSLDATFPGMRRMEAVHGSLFRAMLARRREARAAGTRRPAGGPAGPGGRLTSFRGGLQELIDGLAGAVGGRLRTRCPVRAVSDMGRRGFRVHLGEGAPLEADAVILACPAWNASALVQSMDAALADVLDEIPSAPLVVVHFGYHLGALGEAPGGFGFLVPRGQGPRILGTLWISSIFEGRAPAGRVLMTSMIGGAHDPAAPGLPDDALVRTVREDLRRVMGIVAAPYFIRVMRHPRGIPQYTLGHRGRLDRIRAALERRPGLHVAGNSYAGISVNACIEEAPTVADAVLEEIAEESVPGRP